MCYFALFLVLLVCTFSLKATEQEPDYIIHEGKKYKLEVDWVYPSPMDTYFIRTKRNDFFRENREVISTGNWRAHVATWEIRDSKLYLLNVSVEYIAGYDTVEYSKGDFREKAIIRDTIHQPRYYSINSSHAVFVTPMECKVLAISIIDLLPRFLVLMISSSHIYPSNLYP